MIGDRTPSLQWLTSRFPLEKSDSWKTETLLPGEEIAGNKLFWKLAAFLRDEIKAGCSWLQHGVFRAEEAGAGRGLLLGWDFGNAHGNPLLPDQTRSPIPAWLQGHPLGGQSLGSPNTTQVPPPAAPAELLLEQELAGILWDVIRSLGRLESAPS